MRKLKKIVIDGIFLTKQVTGIQRYAIEITKELDKLVTKEDDISLLTPEYYSGDFGLNNIPIVKYGKRSGRMWEQTDLPDYLKKEKAEGLFFENTIPLSYRKGIVVIHDVSLRANPDLFNKSLHNISSIIWRRILYRTVTDSRMKIITVSNFSKTEIEKYYKVSGKRIAVVYNAWQHMNNVEANEGVFADDRIKKNDYYFAMATLAPNKNFKWITSAAEQNPEETFVIAGGWKIKDVISAEYSNLKNLIYLGYVSDEDAKALMGNCKAFLFLSFYEGFGIPPLEAVASGAAGIIISDTPCMHEVYGEDGTYIDPHDYQIDMKQIDIVKVDRERLLGKYSWEKSAGKLKRLLERI